MRIAGESSRGDQEILSGEWGPPRIIRETRNSPEKQAGRQISSGERSRLLGSYDGVKLTLMSLFTTVKMVKAMKVMKVMKVKTVWRLGGSKAKRRRPRLLQQPGTRRAMAAGSGYAEDEYVYVAHNCLAAVAHGRQKSVLTGHS